MADGGEAMEAAPSAKPRLEPPPIPPNYVSLRQLQELRLKEKEQEEKRRREEEEAAAAKQAAALKAEAAAMAAAAKQEAALKAATKGRSVSRGEAFCGAKERHRGGQGHKWVAVAHPAPTATPRPTSTCGEVAAEKREWGDRGKKGADDVSGNAPHPHGECKPLGKGKGKAKGKWKGKKASSCHIVDEAGNLAKLAPAASNGGKPENKGELKAMGKASGDQTAESRSSGGPFESAAAAVASSGGHLTCKGRKGAGGRSAETSLADAPAKTSGPSPPRGVKSDNTGKPKPAAPRRAEAGTGSGPPEGKKAAPAPAPSTSAADGSRKAKGGGQLRKTAEAKPEDLVEGQRRQTVVQVQAVTKLNPRATRWSVEPWRGRGNGVAEPHGRVWVPKTAAGSSAGAEL